eukprot:CAMPEP_0184239656 /NCGR_PEP_ID=MMETSP0976-20121227/27495_1 /TAXON_ID=483370 /ORGANISM="non described non described, Strain CCMP2097" /LENGTH=106 /DNA_ID=CAMNT_0026544873 /DNA_START=29 /DNA_END=346 /DNA_ORIENTATION=-
MASGGRAASLHYPKDMLPRKLGVSVPPPQGDPRAGGAPHAGHGGQNPILNSSPYMKSMAMLDGLDLQQLMSGGDLHGTPPGAVRAPSDCPGGGRPAYSSPLTQAAD